MVVVDCCAVLVVLDEVLASVVATAGGVDVLWVVVLWVVVLCGGAEAVDVVAL
jgi:hypothetical protein